MHLHARIFSLVYLLLLGTPLWAQGPMDQYLDRIRDNRAALTAFLSQMPKGGDIHHHYTGSVYAESFVRNAISADLFIEPQTLALSEKAETPAYRRLSSFGPGEQQQLRSSLLRLWSTMDYQPDAQDPSHAHFFATFEHFDIPSEQQYPQGLLELKRRAQGEGLSYIETMFTRVPYAKPDAKAKAFDAALREAQAKQDTAQAQRLLGELMRALPMRQLQTQAKQYAQWIERLHDSLGIDEQGFAMRYQTYVLRFQQPSEIFTSLLASFEATDRSPLLVGVNIVAPEHGQTALQDCWLHMQMFRYCQQRYPKVRYAMHAGELVLGLTPPEEMRWHIRAAMQAGASRIGHGVDLPHEQDPYGLLRELRQKGVAIEINLSSNEFILGVKDDHHPIGLYKQAGVPMALCTDDAGVLRIDLTEEYRKLASRYPQFSYQDIKQLVYNSLRYSFIEEPKVKERLLQDLDSRFAAFEAAILQSQVRQQ